MEVHFNGKVNPLPSKAYNWFLQFFNKIEPNMEQIKTFLISFPRNLHEDRVDSPTIELNFSKHYTKLGMDSDFEISIWVTEDVLHIHAHKTPESKYDDNALVMAWEDEKQGIHVGPNYNVEGGWEGNDKDTKRGLKN